MTEQTLNVMVMAGGTGGHVFPALAVADQLRERGHTVQWLGTARGIEAELVPAANIALHYLTIEGVRGKGLKSLLKAPLQLAAAVKQAASILRAQSADVVLGMGGFASGPGGLAAKLLGIPVVVHEQNAVAGTTNRYLAKLASQCLEAFPNSLPKAQHVGNPVRNNIGAVEPLQIDDERPLRVLVLGGSLGALALNEMLPQALASIDQHKRPQVRHQTGKKHIEFTQNAYEKAGVEASVEAFIDDMASAYEWADVLVCRAGALTVSELTLAGRGALLVPFPFAIDDHQTRNAQWLVDNNAGRLLQQKDMTVEALVSFINLMNSDRQRLQTMGANARSLAMPNAASEVADCCEQAVAKQEKHHGR